MTALLAFIQRPNASVIAASRMYPRPAGSRDAFHRSLTTTLHRPFDCCTYTTTIPGIATAGTGGGREGGGRGGVGFARQAKERARGRTSRVVPEPAIEPGRRQRRQGF